MTQSKFNYRPTALYVSSASVYVVESHFRSLHILSNIFLKLRKYLIETKLEEKALRIEDNDAYVKTNASSDEPYSEFGDEYQVSSRTRSSDLGSSDRISLMIN